MSSHQTDYDKVREFTQQAGQYCSPEPESMNRGEVEFLIRMCLSELQELALTVTGSVDESVDMLRRCVGTIDKSEHAKLDTEDDVIAAQADSLVDLYYYGLNAFSKKSVDISEIFDTVHASNMAKRDPKTLQFIKRDDGKIIKPDGWTAPDITAIIRRQRAIARAQNE